MISIQSDNPRSSDVIDLLAAHLTFMNEHSAPEDVHALDIDGLCANDVDFFAARQNQRLMGVGALRWLSDEHVELKSMHTSEAARGQGIGRAMVQHLVGVARSRGATRVSLETGTMEAMAPARALYCSFGFVRCEPFGSYFESAASVCMTLELGEDAAKKS